MTGIFSHHAFDDHERVLHWADRASGLRAIVAIFLMVTKPGA